MMKQNFAKVQKTLKETLYTALEKLQICEVRKGKVKTRTLAVFEKLEYDYDDSLPEEVKDFYFSGEDK